MGMWMDGWMDLGRIKAEKTEFSLNRTRREKAHIDSSRYRMTALSICGLMLSNLRSNTVNLA